MVFTEKFEETKEVIKSHILKKEIQYNSKRDKKTQAMVDMTPQRKQKIE